MLSLRNAPHFGPNQQAKSIRVADGIATQALQIVVSVSQQHLELIVRQLACPAYRPAQKVKAPTARHAPQPPRTITPHHDHDRRVRQRPWSGTATLLKSVVKTAAPPTRMSQLACRETSPLASLPQSDRNVTGLDDDRRATQTQAARRAVLLRSRASNNRLSKTGGFAPSSGVGCRSNRESLTSDSVHVSHNL